MNAELFQNPSFIILIVALSFFDLVMKIISMWRAARNNQMIWFLCLGIFNTVGILPIVYLMLHRYKKN